MTLMMIVASVFCWKRECRLATPPFEVDLLTILILDDCERRLAQHTKEEGNRVHQRLAARVPETQITNTKDLLQAQLRGSSDTAKTISAYRISHTHTQHFPLLKTPNLRMPNLI